jgi:predicted transcriptional regulator
MEWKEAKKRLLKEDPELYKELDNLKPEYQVIRQIILLRKEKNLTQHDLARLIKVSQPNISRLESGNYNPTLSTLKRIADVLDKELQINFI